MYRERKGPDNRHRLTYVRGAGATSVLDLLARVSSAVTGGTEAPVTSRSAGQLLASLERELRERPAGPPQPVVVLDDPHHAAGNALFGSMRDELWALGLQWLVAIPNDEATALLRPPADAFFEIRVDLQPLDDAAAGELLNRGIHDAPADFVLEATRVAGGHPRRLLDVARMGWTRPRVVQVLGQLEEAGLVERQPVKTGGGGRPRMVYPLVPATAFAPAETEGGQ